MLDFTKFVGINASPRVMSSMGNIVGGATWGRTSTLVEHHL